MRFSNTLKLLALVVLLGLVVWVLDRHLASSEARLERSTRVLDLEFDDVCYVRMEHGDLQAECIKDAGNWHIQWPLRGRADKGRVERILAFMEALARSEVVTSAQRRRRRLTLEDYGLDAPRARFVVRDRFNRGELLVGHDAPLGKLLYVMLKGREEVIATSALLLDVLPKGVNELRDRTLVKGDAARTGRVAIHRPGGGFLQLTQTAGEWMLQQPVVGHVDDSRITEMLNVLYSLQVKQFVWDAPAGGEGATELPDDVDARFEPYGLARDEAAARITVWVEGDEVGRELVLGKAVADQPGQVYARLKDIDSIFCVSKGILDTFSVTPNDIRDRALFHLEADSIRYAAFERGDRRLALRRVNGKEWSITKPVQWKADADKVHEVLGALAAMRVERFLEEQDVDSAALGLDMPACIVRLADADPVSALPRENGSTLNGTPANTLSLRIGQPREGAQTVYAQFEGDPTVLEIRPGFLATATFSLTDPYGFRDRTVLALDPELVNRLSLVRAGKEQVVSREDAGPWQVVEPEGAQAVSEAIDGTLFLAAHAQALRAEPFDLKRQAEYGLAKPTATLTFGLAGEAGIQKSLVIGARSGEDGWYTMLQGQDVVFVLPDATGQRLMSDLVRVPDEGPSPRHP